MLKISIGIYTGALFKLYALGVKPRLFNIDKCIKVVEVCKFCTLIYIICKMEIVVPHRFVGKRK